MRKNTVIADGVTLDTLRTWAELYRQKQGEAPTHIIMSDSLAQTYQDLGVVLEREGAVTDVTWRWRVVSGLLL